MKLTTDSARRSRTWPLLLSCALFVAAVLAPPRLDAQDRAWRLPGLDSGELRQADVGQGVTVLVVFAGWSPRCRDIVPRVNDLAGSWGGRARVVAVDFQEEAGEVRSFLAGKGLRVPAYLDLDGSFSKRHRISTLPGLVVYRDGQVLHQGRLPDDPDALLRDLLQ